MQLVYIFGTGFYELFQNLEILKLVHPYLTSFFFFPQFFFIDKAYFQSRCELDDEHYSKNIITEHFEFHVFSKIMMH